MKAAPLTDAIRGFGTGKQIARVIGCSEETAARYRRGETVPDIVSLTRLMGRSRSVTAAVLAMAGLSDLIDIETAWLMRELRAVQARHAGPIVIGANDNHAPERKRRA